VCHTLHLLAICFAPSLADSFIFLTLTRLVVVIIFENFSFALFTPPSRRLSLVSKGSGPDPLIEDRWGRLTCVETECPYMSCCLGLPRKAKNSIQIVRFSQLMRLLDRYAASSKK
jgi:hypothetical protein